MQKSCFLFGHADAPVTIINNLEIAIENEISNGTTSFYVGNHGCFDRMATTALRRAKSRHEHISLMLLLAYHPAERAIITPNGFDGTFYPPLENTPRKYAIVKANQYMVKESDSIICYVKHYGNARNLFEYAISHKSVSICNLATKL